MTVYQVQFTDYSGQWYVCADHRVECVELLEKDERGLHQGMSASGRVWQRTGMHATEDLDYAKQCLARARRLDTKGWTYRLIRRRIVQKVEVLQEETWA
ncbi:hypothetical protein FDH38_gp001 [Dinoroseobacter phage vB_DshS-R5C]|uniref:Uncharacterized protein n=1 Tax=Dinoroseobacter phage vB_DshS-R5C TaxID=1965368 RepID=A0A1V0DY25_9CAUD|nr:hypothetical protein FDH38_gp001 [Dinoroseobacter phage vB_DshS-R5C]ARB06055.1 hypothetical protein vBDshSR5C_1 [Dinoroseobacter phage vB_DshS-R5C]